MKTHQEVVKAAFAHYVLQVSVSEEDEQREKCVAQCWMWPENKLKTYFSSVGFSPGIPEALLDDCH